MPGVNTPITDREKAAIFCLVYGLFQDWTTAYIAADEKPTKTAGALAALNTAVSRWKNCAKVKTFAEHCARIIADRDSDARQRGREEILTGRDQRTGESEPTKNERPNTLAPVDYYDPKNQKERINAIIAESSGDYKTQLDAIKAIQQTQRDDKQAAKEGKTVKVYLPLTCDICPYREKKRQKAAQKGSQE